MRKDKKKKRKEKKKGGKEGGREKGGGFLLTGWTMVNRINFASSRIT